jgi:integrase/recombinase XerD
VGTATMMAGKRKAALKVVTAPSTELAELVGDYIAEKRASGLRPASIKSVRDALESLWLPWAAKHGVTTAAQLDQGLVEAWSRYLLEERRTPDGKPMARESVRTYLRPLRGFVRWAQERGQLGKVKVPMPKTHERAVKVLTRAEIADMERAADSERDKIIIRLLGDTGIRLGELLSLRREDLIKNKDERFIRVRGKGARERMVTVKPSLFDRMDHYSKRPQAKNAETSYLFLTDRKRNGAYSALRGRTVQQLLKFAAVAAGITTLEKGARRIYPHLFRHSAITWMVNSGYPVEHIRQQVGHADLTLITNVYQHVSPSDRYNTFLELIRRDEDDNRR